MIPSSRARLGIDNVEALQKLQRYETAIENELFRALHQLERVQRMRNGDKIPAPSAVDIAIHRRPDEIDATEGSSGD